jgi:hypothetical protein
MELAVSVAPVAGGFRASTGGPLDLTADGPTPDAAVDALRGLVSARFADAAPPPGEVRVIHVTDVRAIVEAATRLSQNPLFDSYLESLAEYRRVSNAVPDAE